MSYTALYRKFRPGRFEDVKGQDHIVTTLKNQLKADRIGHAYLFCGTRGTGKTSIAKLFAKAVNCENPVDGSPCNECATCKAIQAGTSMNVIEIDAASNNGVDNIREIRDEVAYSPTEGKYKVYIIDEVHMLSIGAFNALLKTLEEPPSYVIFILATTESHKIPVTILSRCQRYDFRRISVETLADRLRELAGIEQIEVEDKALTYIAKAADGGMRDALSLLDQCIAFYLGEKLTYDNVLDILGAVDTEVFAEFLDRIADKQVTVLMDMIEKLVMQGRELTQFVTDFTWYLRNLMLIQASPDVEDSLDMSTEGVARLKEIAGKFDSETVIRYIHVFSELAAQMKYAVQKRILLEIAIVKLCKPQMETVQTTESLLERIENIEKQLETGEFTVQTKPVVVQSQSVEPAKKMELPRALPEDLKQVVSRWRELIGMVAKPGYFYLQDAVLSLSGDNRLLLVMKDKTGASYIRSENHLQELINVIEQQIGKQITIDVKEVAEDINVHNEYVDLESLIHMDISIEDDE